jgi:hypothetical protein
VVNFGVRTLLLLLSTILFVLAVFVDAADAWDLLAWGLAGLTASFLLADIGWDRKYGSRAR